MQIIITFGDITTSPQQRKEAEPRMLASLDRHKAKIERNQRVTFAASPSAFYGKDGVYCISLDYESAA